MISHFSINDSKEEKIICIFVHPIILENCKDAFPELGYKVKKLSWRKMDILLRKVLKINPNYLFIINFSETIAKVSNKLNIIFRTFLGQ